LSLFYQQYYADTETTNGEGYNVEKYVLFRQLANSVPPYIEKLMLKYDEVFVANRRSKLTREFVLDLKEVIDDYLEEVQFRVIDRLDDSSLNRLQDYHKMDFDRLVDKINKIPIEERILQLIKS
jgi:hypothetical protein